MRCRLNPAMLMRFKKLSRELSDNGPGLLRRADDVMGYTLHAWLHEMFKDLAPQPFRFVEKTGDVLGYTRATADELMEIAQAFASPQAFEALEPDSLATKAMPTTWTAGRRLQVEVTTSPLARFTNEQGREVECDVYLRTLDRLGEATPAREQVYADWFRRQWGEALRFEQVGIDSFSLVDLLRRPTVAGQRKVAKLVRPQVTFSAVVAIADPQAFAQRLAAGIGRHKTFGYGMVLLKPAP
jgi:CRISPR system Cascade subunit CasE